MVYIIVLWSYSMCLLFQLFIQQNKYNKNKNYRITFPYEKLNHNNHIIYYNIT